MLSEFAVRDLGVIDELALVLGRGMTVVTGETGAGKTLVVGAIDLLAGGRADSALVRPGAREAEVEGRFLVGDDEVVVRRIVPRDGRSRVYIDGHLATVAALGELGDRLIDLHGQHAHQSLLRGPVQRSALDCFGAIDTASLEGLLDDWRAVETTLSELGGDARARAREIDLLRHQLTEIGAAAIEDVDEDDRLERAESLLADAAAHKEAAARAISLLDADGPVSDAIGRAHAALAGRSPFAELAARLTGAAAELADVVATARACSEAIDDDPAALSGVRERRQLLAELRRKYGSSLAEVLDFRAETAERLDELEGHEGRVAVLERRRSAVASQLEAERARIRSLRTEAAPRLAAAVESHLAGLAMPRARLGVTVDGEAGERVVLGLAANPGHEPLPLGRVASGGELARTMLALRMVLTSGPPTLVFDEVDAGIGGSAAHAVGSCLGALAASHQVLVVTHLAQVAAHADCHMAVEKSDAEGSSRVTVKTVTGSDRLAELSRMLSGSPQSGAAREHAEELLAAAAALRGD